MILDQLKNADRYKSLHPDFKTAFDFLKNTPLLALPLGKTPIDGDKVFVAVSEYEPKKPADAKWEAHQKYIDIQFLALGVEEIGYIALSDTEVIELYKPEKDVLFLRPTKSFDKMRLHDDTFALFFPEDAHQPGLSCCPDNVAVRKIVVKIAV